LENFACLPNDEENQLFVEELQDQISLRLSQRTGLRLLEISNLSSSPDYVLQGRINRVASKSRSKLSLVCNESGEVVWAEGYSDNIDDPLTTIENIVDSVDAALRLKLVAFDTRRLLDQEESNLTLSELLTKPATSIYRATIDDLYRALLLAEKVSAADEFNAMALSMRVECSVILASSLPEG
jgi:TolB-like protein